jgi:hypothetical protein
MRKEVRNNHVCDFIRLVIFVNKCSNAPKPETFRRFLWRLEIQTLFTGICHELFSYLAYHGLDCDEIRFVADVIETFLSRTLLLQETGAEARQQIVKRKHEKIWNQSIQFKLDEMEAHRKEAETAFKEVQAGIHQDDFVEVQAPQKKSRSDHNDRQTALVLAALRSGINVEDVLFDGCDEYQQSTEASLVVDMVAAMRQWLA